MNIAMLRGLLCCVGEEKEDEPRVAYTRQDERSRIFFKLLSNDRSLVLVQIQPKTMLESTLLPRQEELRRKEAPEIFMRRSVGFLFGLYPEKNYFVCITLQYLTLKMNLVG